MSLRRCWTAALFALALFTVIPASTVRAQSCASPAVCSDIPVLIDFESLAPGTSVEGLGAVHPALSIQTAAPGVFPSCPVGSAKVIEEGVTTPFVAYGTTTAVDNGCLNGIRGFADSADCALNYIFHIAPGYTIDCFSILIVDFGDYFPFGGSLHEARLTAYDASNTIVDTSSLVVTGGPVLGSGDACAAQAGDPGRKVLFVTAPGIRKVTLTFPESPDPNIGFDDIAFCLREDPVPFLPASWGSVKSRFGE